MKKLLISLVIFLLLAISIPTVKAQVYVTVEPPPTRFGVLYNQKNVLPNLGLVKYDSTKFLSKVGLYGRMYYGKIYFFDHSYTTNARIGVGISIPFRLALEENLYALYVGSAYDFFFNTTGSDFVNDTDKVFPVSVDVGFTMECGRVRILMLLNPYYKKGSGTNFNLSCSAGFSYRLRK